MRHSQSWAAILAALLFTLLAPTPVLRAQDEFSRVSDGRNRFTVAAPAAWDDVSEADWMLDGAPVGVQLTVTPDQAAFSTDWNTHGMIVSYSDLLPATATLTTVLDQIDLSAACRDGGRTPITIGDLAGFVQRWEACGATATVGTVAALAPAADPQFFTILEIYTPDGGDQALVERILASFTAAQAAATPTAAADSPTAATGSIGAPPSRPGLAYRFAARRDPAVTALLPDAYADVESTVWRAPTGEPLGFMLAAAPDLTAFRTSWTTPGIVVRTALSMTRTLDAAALLADADLQTVCAAVERSTGTHVTPAFRYDLVIDAYQGCSGASTYTLAVAQSDPVDHLIFLEFQAVSPADRAALEVFLDSFAVERTAPADDAAAANATPPPLATPEAAPTPTPAPLTGVVLANNLNVRSGPGIDFERLGAAPRTTTLTVTGQIDDCAWLRVSAPGGLEGWVSGSAEFITLAPPCAAIPVVQP
jgi:hypothetical protein